MRLCENDDVFFGISSELKRVGEHIIEDYDMK